MQLDLHTLRQNTPLCSDSVVHIIIIIVAYYLWYNILSPVSRAKTDGVISIFLQLTRCLWSYSVNLTL